MTKAELTEALSKELNLPFNTAKSIITTILDSIANSLVNGENVEIRGFGSFTVRHYDSYTGMNPKTGEKVVVKVKKAPFFKVGMELREAVDGGRQHKCQ
jgi:integration host factor subunit beta